MSNLIRGTTPTLTFRCTSEIDLSTLTEIWFTIAQKSTGTEITYKLSDNQLVIDAEEKTISCSLTQEDTLMFNPNKLEIQIRCIDTDNKSYASDVFVEEMGRIIKGGVISGTNN